MTSSLHDTPDAGRRRANVPEGECPTCDRWWQGDRGIRPYHDPSTRCQSGSHEHCSCGICF